MTEIADASSQFDPDIEAMDLGWGEKSGLQMYRNYTRAFDDHAEKRFAEEIDAEAFDLGPLERLVKLIVTEDPRFLPMIACAFVDDQLRDMLKSQVPDGVPGGKSDLLGRMGPFADLSKRIQLSYVFDLVSRDLLLSLDLLRRARNELAHTWDLSMLHEFFVVGPANKIEAVSQLLESRNDWFPGEVGSLAPIQSFRINLAWMTVRLSYEAPLWSRARKIRLRPHSALYDANRPKRLTELTRISMVATREIVRAPTRAPPTSTP